MTPEEFAVIKAAQDWAGAVIGSHYGPMEHEIKRAENALLDRVADMAAENDGRWTVHTGYAEKAREWGQG